MAEEGFGKKPRLILSLLTFLFGAFFLLNSQLQITGAAVGVRHLSQFLSLVEGLLWILVSAMLFIGSLEKKVGKFRVFETRRGDRFVEVMTDPGHELTSAGQISVEDLKALMHDLDEELNGKIRETFAPYLHTVRDSAKDLVKDTEAKIADDFLRVIEGDSYKPFVPPEKAREDKIRTYEPRFQGMMKGNPVYVHFTSSDSAKRIVDDKEGFNKPGERTYVQALIFPDLDKANAFIEGMDQEEAKKFTGAAHADTAVVFQTKTLPDNINTVASGSAKALFNTDMQYGNIEVRYKRPVKR